MSKQLHKSYRSVLKIVNTQYEFPNGDLVPVKMVYWALVAKRTSRSVYSRHYAITIYFNNDVRHTGIAARVLASNTPKRLTDEVWNSISYRDALGQAIYSYLGGKAYKGQIRWFDASSGFGVLTCNKTGTEHHFYACNVIGADSPFENLVTNVSFETGDIVSFEINKDPYTSRHCGATKLMKEAV